MQCPRTDRKPRSAHVTVLSALDCALPPPLGRRAPGISPVCPFACIFRAPKLLLRLPFPCSLAPLRRVLSAPALVVLSYCSICCSSRYILPHLRFTLLRGPAAAIYRQQQYIGISATRDIGSSSSSGSSTRVAATLAPAVAVAVATAAAILAAAVAPVNTAAAAAAATPTKVVVGANLAKPTDSGTTRRIASMAGQHGI
jgi:hypothetical protein